jgi:hypothetical protein
MEVELEETFIPITDPRILEGYSISKTGVVKDRNGKLIPYFISTSGQPKVVLRGKNIFKIEPYLNRLIMGAFRPREDWCLVYVKDKEKPISVDNLCYADDEDAKDYKKRKAFIRNQTMKTRKAEMDAILNYVFPEPNPIEVGDINPKEIETKLVKRRKTNDDIEPRIKKTSNKNKPNVESIHNKPKSVSVKDYLRKNADGNIDVLDALSYIFD